MMMTHLDKGGREEKVRQTDRQRKPDRQAERRGGGRGGRGKERQDYWSENDGTTT